MIRSTKPLLSLPLALILGACGQTPAPTPPAGPASAPLRTQAGEPGAALLAPAAKVLSSGLSAQLKAYDETTGTLRFGPSLGIGVAEPPQANVVTSAAQLQPGDIVNADQSAVTPYGLLRRVTGVSRQGGEMVVTTSEASLEEAVDTYNEQDLPENIPFVPESVVPLDPGVTLTATPTQTAPASGLGNQAKLAGVRFDVRLRDLELASGPNGQKLLANGQASYEASLNLVLGFKWLKLKTFKTFKTFADFSATKNYRVTGSAGGAFSQAKTIATVTGRPYTIKIQALSVVVQPAFELQLTAEGLVAQPVSLAAQRQDSFQAGIEWTKQNGWREINELTHSVTDVTLEGQQGLVNLAVGPKASVSAFAKVFGVKVVSANAAVYARDYTEFDLNRSRTPYGQLACGLKSGASLSGKIFSNTLSYGRDFFDLRRACWRSADAPPTGSAPGAPSGFQASGGRNLVRLSWAAVPGAAAYVLERQDWNGNYQALATVNATSYTDGGLEPDTSYLYRLRAQSGGGVSPAVEVGATTLAPPGGCGAGSQAQPSPAGAVPVSVLRPPNPC